MHRIAFTLTLLSLAALKVCGELQNVTVKGVTMCDSQPVENLHVMLMDTDSSDADDSLASAHTNKFGEFDLFGEKNGLRSIDVFVRIRHTCNAEPGCERISDYMMPGSSTTQNDYDMTYITLDPAASSEKTNCS